MLQIKNLSKQYSNGHWGIKDFSLEIDRGQIVCIAGQNGAGKTTILNCILGVISLTEGEITYNGYSNKDIEFKKQIAYVPDEVLLIEPLTGNEYINFVRNMYGDICESKVCNLKQLFDLKEFFDEPIETYSHGMKRKIQLISAFMLNSSVIVMDEPLRGLDVESIITLKKLMEKHAGDGGTIILSTHDLIQAGSLSDKVAIISNGKKIIEGEVNSLMDKFNAQNLEEVFINCSQMSERTIEIEKIINNL